MDSPLPMAASASTTTSGLVINSPSNLSYSSGPSHTSTRSTSPDSASASVLSRHSSPLIDLSVAAVSIEHMPNTLLEQPADPNMDSNSFQSVNDRRNKPTSERVTGNQFPLLQQPQQYQQQQQQQQQALASPHLQIARSGLQVSSGHHRGVASANWRANSTEDAIIPQSRIMYSPFDGPATQHSQHPPTRSTPFSHPRMDQHHHLQHSAGVTSYLNLGPISDAQLDSTFAYCYDRGNGQYTRLIPADMLPPLQDIPALQKNSAGMVIVPQPRGLPSNGPSSNTEPVAMQSSPSTPTSSADTIQSRIDNIVAATPPTPVHLAGNPGGGPSSSHGAPSGHRRPKIYCDKWVHEGVCAFTQQGCKYKHEMPADKVTQHQLGLFHGYPQWWKKHQADLARQREAPSPEALKTCGAGTDSRSGNERHFGRTSNSVMGGAGVRGGGLGLASDGAGQLVWRQSGEFGGDAQVLGPPSSVGRPTTSRGVSGTMRNPMAASPPGNNLSPCPVSYGSPFGPIAPPARSTAATSPATERARRPSGVQSMESRSMAQDARQNSPSDPSIAASSIIATSNPYASLDSLDDGGGQNVIDGVDYTEPPRLGGVRLS